MVYVIIALVYISIILVMAVANSKHIGYDVPRKLPRMLNHEVSIETVTIKKTRVMWDR